VDEWAAWMWLSDTADSLTSEPLKLLERYGSPTAIADAKPADLAGLASQRFLEALRRTRERYERPEVSHKMADLAGSGGDMLTHADERYPPALRTIPNPPLILFVRGRLRSFERAVAVIGTRAPTHKGYTAARVLAEQLAREGYCVVSGLARGIDTMAHCGALDSGGTTVAVLPGPLTFLYPPENVLLAEDIARSGALVAENSPLVNIDGRPGQRYRWVTRNRITSGLSDALVVVEATDSGGSMHQIRFAVEQRRRICILAPGIEAPARIRRGFDEAVALGAEPFDSGEELLQMLKAHRMPRDAQQTLPT